MIMDPLQVRHLTEQQIRQKLENLPETDNVFAGGFGISRNASRDFFAGGLITLGTPYRIQENRIILITGGTATFQANLTHYRAQRCDVFIQRQGMLVQADSFSDDFRCLVISHSESACQIPGHLQSSETLLSLDGNTFILAERYADILWELLHRNLPPMNAVAQTLIALYSLLRTMDGTENPVAHGSRRRAVTSAFLQMVTEKCATEHALRFYAEALCVSQHYLCTAVKGVTGKTPKDWIDRALMQEIRCRLLYSEDSLLTISEELGFTNPSFFNRFFKNRQHLTPGQYRKLKT